MHWGVDAWLPGMGLKWTLGGSDGVCESDTLGLRILYRIGIWEGPSLGLMLEYTLCLSVGLVSEVP